MIIYFSATGNSAYVAKRVADATNDVAYSILDWNTDNPLTGNSIGIVSPTYAFGLPLIVDQFLRKIRIESDAYIWFAATYGTMTGQIGWLANELLKQHTHSIDAYFSIRMPDTWTPMFNLSNKEKVQKINDAAEPQIDFLIQRVKQRVSGDFMRNKMPQFVARMEYHHYDSMRKTSHFHVEDSCIGCGLCAKRCPIQAIEMLDGKPVWKVDRCVMCLGCLHHCPKFAIQYGKGTKKHGQYQHP